MEANLGAEFTSHLLPDSVPRNGACCLHSVVLRQGALVVCGAGAGVGSGGCKHVFCL